MNSIDLCELNFKIKKIKFDLDEIEKKNKKMLQDITNVNDTYDDLLFKKHPKGHPMNAVNFFKFLKSPKDKYEVQ